MLRRLHAVAATAIVTFAMTPAWATPSAGGRDDTGVRVEWNGKKRDSSDLPKKLPRSAREALRKWEPWALERGYSFTISEDGRVVLVRPKRGSASRSLKLIERVCTDFDAFLPAPTRGLSVTLYDDPLSETSERERGSGNLGALDRDSVVLLDLANELDLRSAAFFLADEHEYLRDWAEAEGSTQSGFVLYRPLCGAWLDDAPGEVEWDADNELVHRLTSLLLLRRFGPLPDWAHRGFCWRLEHNLRGDVESFPNASEPTETARGWSKQLKSRLRSRESSLRFEEIADWGEDYGNEQAALAWGTLSYLTDEHPEILSRFFEDLRVVREREGVTRAGGRGTVAPLERQLELLEIHVSRDVLDELTEYMARGRMKKKVKKPRRRRA